MKCFSGLEVSHNLTDFEAYQLWEKFSAETLTNLFLRNNNVSKSLRCTILCLGCTQYLGTRCKCSYHIPSSLAFTFLKKHSLEAECFQTCFDNSKKDLYTNVLVFKYSTSIRTPFMAEQEWSAIARTLIYTRLTNTQPSLCMLLHT